jgi:hypothetical protein
MISRAEKRRALKLERKEQKRNLKENQPDSMPRSSDIPPELAALFASETVICFGEEDEDGNDIEYNMMSLSDEEFYLKLENMGKKAK